MNILSIFTHFSSYFLQKTDKNQQHKSIYTHNDLNLTMEMKMNKKISDYGPVHNRLYNQLLRVLNQSHLDGLIINKTVKMMLQATCSIGKVRIEKILSDLLKAGLIYQDNTNMLKTLYIITKNINKKEF